MQLVIIALRGRDHGRGAPLLRLHAARQGNAGHGGQPLAGPQLGHPHRPGRDHHLGDLRWRCAASRGACSRIDAGSFGATSTDLFLVLILAAVFLGGPGTGLRRDARGALVIGIGTEVSAAYITPAYKDVVAFVLLLGMLALRPTGLLGART